METNDEYLNIINKLVKDLLNHPELETGHPSEVLKSNENDFSYFEEEYGILFSSKIKSIYKQVDGFSISWKYKNIYSGEINMTTIGALVEGIYDDFWKDGLKKYKSKEDKTFRQFWENLYSLDIFNESFDGTLRVVAEIKRNSPESQSPPLWLWNLAGEKYPLTLEIPQYWQKLAKTRGFIGWPYFFIDLEKCSFENANFNKYFSSSISDAIPHMKDFLKMMPFFFPDDDFSEFEELYQKMKASF